MLVLRGAEAMTLVPGRARIAEDSDRRYVMQRDYEVTAHTHSPDQYASTKYPSPDDIYAFIEDGDKLKREYNLIFISGKKTKKPQEVIIIHLPLEKQEQLRKKYYRNYKTKKAFFKNLERDFFDKETIKMTEKGIDTPHNRKQMDKVLKRWNQRYGITFTRLSTSQLEDYEFRIKPQNQGRSD